MTLLLALVCACTPAPRDRAGGDTGPPGDTAAAAPPCAPDGEPWPFDSAESLDAAWGHVFDLKTPLAAAAGSVAAFAADRCPQVIDESDPLFTAVHGDCEDEDGAAWAGGFTWSSSGRDADPWMSVLVFNRFSLTAERYYPLFEADGVSSRTVGEDGLLWVDSFRYTRAEGVFTDLPVGTTDTWVDIRSVEAGFVGAFELTLAYGDGTGGGFCGAATTEGAETTLTLVGDRVVQAVIPAGGGCGAASGPGGEALGELCLGY